MLYCSCRLSLHRIERRHDALGRLAVENFDSYDNALDFTANYTYDLTGNRLKKTLDNGSNSSIDETTDSLFDANDRLIYESKDLASGTDTTTTYSYGGTNDPATRPSTKTVKDTAGNTLSVETDTYNLQDQLSQPSMHRIGLQTRVPKQGHRDLGRRERQRKGVQTSAQHPRVPLGNTGDQVGSLREGQRTCIAADGRDDLPLHPELPEGIFDRLRVDAESRDGDVSAGCIPGRRNPAPVQRVPAAHDAHESVSEQRL